MTFKGSAKHIFNSCKCKVPFYKCPLPRKRQRVMSGIEPSGPVKFFSKEEIKKYQMNMEKSV